MKHYERIIASLLVGFCVLLAYLYANNTWRDNSTLDAQNECFLVRPVFAQTSGSTFLEQEAGISIYMKTNAPIDLAKAKTVCKNIEKETSEYIIGSLSLPNLSDNDDVHCFVHTAGWIVVYYLKTEPIGKIIDWNYYTSGVLTTKLQVGLEKVANGLGLSVAESKYYHFQYPYANKFVVIIDLQQGRGEDTFRIKVPSTFMIYELSWVHNNYYGTLTLSQLTPDVFHIIKATVDASYYSYFIFDEKTINKIGMDWNKCFSNVAIILVYKET